MGRRPLTIQKGERFNYLTAVYPDEVAKSGYWVWQCDCGNKSSFQAWQVKQGIVKSCGCYGRYALSVRTRRRFEALKGKTFEPEPFIPLEWRKEEHINYCRHIEIRKKEPQYDQKIKFDKNAQTVREATAAGMTYGQYMAQKQLKEYAKEWEAIREQNSANLQKRKTRTKAD